LLGAGRLLKVLFGDPRFIKNQFTGFITMLCRCSLLSSLLGLLLVLSRGTEKGLLNDITNTSKDTSKDNIKEETAKRPLVSLFLAIRTWWIITNTHS
jgi:hypothetical protein